MFQIQCVIFMLALKKGYCAHIFVFFHTFQLSNKLSVPINFSLPGSVNLSHPIYMCHSELYLSSGKGCVFFLIFGMLCYERTSR